MAEARIGEDEVGRLARHIRTHPSHALTALEASIQAGATHAALGAISHLDLEPARRRTEIRQPLHASHAGVPSLAKDLGGPFQGLPTRAGSACLPPAAGPHAAAVDESDLGRRLRARGLNVFGLSTVPEFGLSLVSEPAIGPIARNPLDPSRTPGGSSGGAAAAVARGIVATAHATDAGGSIRVPAACCGLYGLKPSRGVVPQGPDFGNLLGGLASEFMLCRSISDVVAAFHDLKGGDGPFPGPALPDPSEHPRIGLLLSSDGVDDDRLQALEDAALTLSANPVRLDPARLTAQLVASAEVFDRMISVNLASLSAALSLDESHMEALSAAVCARGRAITATQLWESFTSLARVSYEMVHLFRDIDVLVLPMLCGPPPPIGHFPTDHDDVDAHWERLNRFAPNATLANVSGCPAISVPFGTDEHGLPVAVQLMAGVGADRALIRSAQRLEREQRWQQRFAVAGMPDE